MADSELKLAREAEYGYKDSSGREQRFAEWASGRDDPRKDKEFIALCNRLRARNWYLEVRAEGGFRLERLRRNGLEYWRRNSGRRRAARIAEQKRKAPVITCDCGAKFCIIPWLQGRPPRWCSLTCQKRGRDRERKKSIVDQCSECLTLWCRVPWYVGSPRRQCSPECVRKAANRRDREARKKRNLERTTQMEKKTVTPRGCVYPKCRNTSRTRGLCHGHYQTMRDRVRKGIADEKDLERRGLLMPKGTGGSPTNVVRDSEGRGAFEKGSTIVGRAN